MSLVCSRCRHVGEPVSSTPGSIWIELVLWLCLLIPGLVYSLWRLSRRHPVCARCGSADLLPVDTPRGRELAGPPAPAAAVAPVAPPRAGAVNAGRALGALFRRR
jgi:hypothetical protein